MRSKLTLDIEVHKTGFDLLYEDLILYIATFLNLPALFYFSLTNIRHHQIAKKVEVDDWYLDFILVSIQDYERIEALDLKKISEQHQNKPLLIKSGLKIYLYGVLNNQWKLTEMDNPRPLWINFPSLPYRKVMQLVNSKEEILKFGEHSFFRINKVGWFIWFLKIFSLPEDREFLFTHKKNGFLTVYWNNGSQLLEHSLPLEEVKEIVDTLSDSLSISKNNDLTKAIVEQYDCTPVFNTKYMTFGASNSRLKKDGLPPDTTEHMLHILRKGHSCLIKFSDILNRNHERQLRTDRIKELTLKRENTASMGRFCYKFFNKELIQIKKINAEGLPKFAAPRKTYSRFGDVCRFCSIIVYFVLIATLEKDFRLQKPALEITKDITIGLLAATVIHCAVRFYESIEHLFEEAELNYRNEQEPAILFNKS